jgi:hypothetical protein
VKRLVVALLASGLVGCATASPIFYENQKYEEVGRSAPPATSPNAGS